MASYTHEYSDFPNSILTRHNFRDADNSIASELNQIKQMQAEGKYDEVAAYINQHASRLTPYVLGSAYMNLIDEETRNLEIYAKSNKQQIYYQTEEPDNEPAVNDVWLGTR